MSRLSPGAAQLAVALLAAWFGAALFFAGIVAPAAFRLLSSRTAAGALVGGTLPALFVSGIVIALIAGGLAGVAPRGTARTLTIGCAIAAALCCAVGLYLVHRIDALRASAAVPLELLAADDPLRHTFGWLHGVSVLALGAAMILAVVAAGALARSRATSAPAAAPPHEALPRTDRS